jgi:hypothetical protein
VDGLAGLLSVFAADFDSVLTAGFVLDAESVLDSVFASDLASD